MGGRVPAAELGAQGWDRVRPPNSAIEVNHVQCMITKTKINTKICDAQNIKIFHKVRVGIIDFPLVSSSNLAEQVHCYGPCLSSRS